jgi:hypothetical protein
MASLRGLKIRKPSGFTKDTHATLCGKTPSQVKGYYYIFVNTKNK